MTEEPKRRKLIKNEKPKKETPNIAKFNLLHVGALFLIAFVIIKAELAPTQSEVETIKEGVTLETPRIEERQSQVLKNIEASEGLAALDVDALLRAMEPGESQTLSLPAHDGHTAEITLTLKPADDSGEAAE